jgi:hypothetical protein
MSPTEDTGDLTVGNVLLGDSTDTGERTKVLTRSFDDHGVVRSGMKGLRHLSGPALRVITTQLAEVVLQSLNLVDLKDLLVGGWCKHKELIEAGNRTRGVPGSEELVALAAHQIASSHQPSVDLMVRDALVYTCVFDLSVEFDLNGVLALVRQGELVSLRGGTCLITVALALGEVPLLPPQQRQVDLAKAIKLNPAVRLPEKALPGSRGSKSASP